MRKVLQFNPYHEKTSGRFARKGASGVAAPAPATVDSDNPTTPANLKKITGLAEKFEDITPEQRMAQANYADISHQVDLNLGAIRTSNPSRRKVSGPLSDDTLGTIADNARAEIEAYSGYLSGDTTNLLHRYVSGLERDIRRALPEFAGVGARDMDALVTDCVRKMVHLEVESNRQSFTDHGIRHMVKNVEMQNQVADALAAAGFGMTARERVLMNVAMVNHDVGYTVPLVRAGGLRGIKASSEHKEYSAKIWGEQEHLWDQGKVFTKKEFDHARELIRTHDGTDLNPRNPMATSMRIADNLALFQRDKLPSTFRYIRGGRELLVEMGKASRAGDDTAFEGARQRLIRAIDRSGHSAAMKRDLVSAVGEINKLTPKFTLGVLAGEITGIKSGKKVKSKPIVETTMKFNEFDSFLQEHFDMGQKQAKKLLGDFGVTDFSGDTYDLGDADGRPVLRIRVTGSKARKSLVFTEAPDED
jgi:hypothetical protein